MSQTSGLQLEGGRQGGAVELAQLNEPNGPSNGVAADHAGNKGEFFTGHPQDGGKPHISSYEDFKKKRVIWVKKSLKDPTAALSYTLSVSILHLAMVVGLIFVKRPDIDVATQMPE